MGLGQDLRNAREAKKIDIRDAALQLRISINYLKALEEEDFSKLPGEVFVKGFLKNYVRFLNLDEAEMLKQYADLRPKPQQAPSASTEPERTAASAEHASDQKTPLEPFVWGAVISVALLVFLFSSLPGRGRIEHQQNQIPGAPLASTETQTQMQPSKPEKLYLEIDALEDTWLLVRTDTSPQKKAVLKKGESLIWSADERFLISYGHVGDVKLLLNGEELTVKASPQTTVRDLAVTRAGILNQPSSVKQPQPVHAKPKPAVEKPVVNQSPVPKTSTTAAPAPTPAQANGSASAPAPVPAPAPTSAPVPAAPAREPAPVTPDPQPSAPAQ